MSALPRDFFLYGRGCTGCCDEDLSGRGLGGAGRTGLISFLSSVSDPEDPFIKTELSSWDSSSSLDSDPSPDSTPRELSSMEMICPTRGCGEVGVVFSSSPISTSSSSVYTI